MLKRYYIFDHLYGYTGLVETVLRKPELHKKLLKSQGHVNLKEVCRSRYQAEMRKKEKTFQFNEPGLVATDYTLLMVSAKALRWDGLKEVERNTVNTTT